MYATELYTLNSLKFYVIYIVTLIYKNNFCKKWKTIEKGKSERHTVKRTLPLVLTLKMKEGGPEQGIQQPLEAGIHPYFTLISERKKCRTSVLYPQELNFANNPNDQTGDSPLEPPGGNIAF